MENNNLIKDGRLHCHSNNSLMDAIPTVDSMCQKASSMGARALAITDHGTVAGWWSFNKAAKKYGIKPIFGVEAYVGRHHLIMLAKNNIGLHEISLMVTESNKHLDQVAKNVYPRMSKEIIEQFMGEGTKGHGNIVLTSACVGGVLAGLSLDSDKAEIEITKLNTKIEAAEDAKRLFKDSTDKFEELKDLLKQAKEKSIVKGYAHRKKVASKIEDESERNKALEELEKESEQANYILNTVVPDLSKKKRYAQKAVTESRKRLVPEAKLEKMYADKAEYEKKFRTFDQLQEAMREEAVWYDKVAGHGNFFIELQYHGDRREKKWMPILDNIAHELDIPVIAANDEHMLKKEDLLTRKYLNSMRFVTFNWDEPNEADPELYYKSDEELQSAIRGCIGIPEHVQEAMDNIGKVIDMCNAEPLREQAYPVFDSSWTKEQSDKFLEDQARAGIASRYPDWTDELEKRLSYELHIINSMGYTDYFLIVQWYVGVGRMLGHMPAERFSYLENHIDEMNLDEIISYIKEDQSAPGLAVGPGRGSGAGSIVCYLTGITSIDPIAHNLVFERFLNPERVSMPDIDEDFAKFIRGLLIKIVGKRFGQDGVACIMTRNTLAAKKAIQMVAKVHGSKTKGDPKYFLSLGSQITSVIPKNDPKATIAKYEEDIVAAFGNDKDAMDILDMAKRLEGTYVTTGMHAAGVVIVDNHDIRQYTPLMWDPENNLWKTQMDKEEVEKNGMLKMDFLGLINLDIITDCLRLIKKNHPNIDDKELDVENYVFDPDIIKKIYAQADTDSVFQFESSGMKKMLKRFKPDKFDDLVLLNAAYRPGPMQFLDDVINVKNGESPSYLCPQLEPILKNTYGSIIYQEQVMEIFKQLAGYSLGGADLVRRAMGHKEMDVLTKERDSFVNGDVSRNIKGCAANGIDAGVANKLFDQMMKFAEYAFNKSHAAAYSKVSYITAYLKAKYPVEYFCTILSYEDQDKRPALIDGCRRRGITVHTPDINISEVKMSTSDGIIYFGLGNVLGVAAAAQEIVSERAVNGTFTSLQDFLQRTACKKNAFSALVKAGAFDEFRIERTCLMDNAEAVCDASKSILKITEQINVKENLLRVLQEKGIEEASKLNNGKKPSVAVLTRSLTNLRQQESDLKLVFSKALRGNSYINNQAILNAEKEVLGMYVSATPLTGFQKTSYTVRKSGNITRKAKYENLHSTEYGEEVYMLIYPEDIQDRMTKEKVASNGNRKAPAPFIVFSSDTPFGQLRSMCFDELTIYDLKQTRVPVIAKGYIKADRQNDEEFVFFISAIQDAKSDYKKISVSVSNPLVWNDLCKMADADETDESDREYVITGWFDEFTRLMFESDLVVTDDILKNFDKTKLHNVDFVKSR